MSPSAPISRSMDDHKKELHGLKNSPSCGDVGNTSRENKKLKKKSKRDGKAVENGELADANGTAQSCVDDSEKKEDTAATKDTPEKEAQYNSNDCTQEDPAETIITRVILKTLTYIGYDALGELGYKDQSRVIKILIESVVDESTPTNVSFHEMKLPRKLLEYLLPCGISSLLLYIFRKYRNTIQLSKHFQHHHYKYHRPSILSIATPNNNNNNNNFPSALLLPPSTFRQNTQPLESKKLLWVVSYRLIRQAIIYRLFFRLNSKRYYLTTLFGLICCFFQEKIFKEILSLSKWKNYLDIEQGLWAILKSIVYALAFCIPLQKVGKKFFEKARRRANTKKLIFAVVFVKTSWIKQLITKCMPLGLLNT